ncbi:MAG: LemA family protein [Algicola sp.]|nr:LemA family protein [Algicola sp.]
MIYLFIPFALVLLFVVFLYNNLISKRNKVKETYSSIDVMLKKRSDLIPQLVNTVQGYLKHESETLTSITKLRKNLEEHNPPVKQRLNIESEIDRLLGAMKVSVEAYPDLKADHNFLLLQSSLNEIEEQLSATRRAYNAAVNTFNNGLEMFPSNIMGRLMRYTEAELFMAQQSEKTIPKIHFD